MALTDKQRQSMVETPDTGRYCLVEAQVNTDAVLVECKCLGVKFSYSKKDYILEPVLNPGMAFSVRDRIVRWLPVDHDPTVCDNCQHEYFDKDGNQVKP